ncbi:hypothetical protein GH714_022816 [Hevea brasiliensis]|uniref:FAR1-related sequence 11-like HTH-like domain-containing protein n=1 Tax=Hevea brasiliensis TaxID=3981 RepID=A0A6A6KTY0_HEVBR|nr:hypothetical protein GH714_022816 [Hevea brasiliensis]
MSCTASSPNSRINSIQAFHEIAKLSCETVLSPQIYESLLKAAEELPVLVSAGAEDALVPLKSSQIKASELEILQRLAAISGCGHLPNGEECPKALSGITVLIKGWTSESFLRVLSNFHFLLLFSNVHNHELLEDDQVRLLPAYRKIQEADQERILLLSKAGFPVNRIVKVLELEKGVQPGQLPFIEKDVRNFVRTCKKTVQENDALLTERERMIH